MVQSIMLLSNHFSGKISPEIGNCSKLTHLNLRNNKLSGSIPTEICNSGSLLEIDLGSNLLSGTIDDSFVQCNNLTSLVLRNNQITGSIPNHLSKLPLTVLDIEQNNFTGTIPKSLWSSEKLLEFNAAHNFLGGKLSKEIAKASALQRLVLRNNFLTGTEMLQCCKR